MLNRDSTISDTASIKKIILNAPDWQHIRRTYAPGPSFWKTADNDPAANAILNALIEAAHYPTESIKQAIVELLPDTDADIDDWWPLLYMLNRVVFKVTPIEPDNTGYRYGYCSIMEDVTLLWPLVSPDGSDDLWIDDLPSAMTGVWSWDYVAEFEVFEKRFGRRFPVTAGGSSGSYTPNAGET